MVLLLKRRNILKEEEGLVPVYARALVSRPPHPLYIHIEKGSECWQIKPNRPDGNRPSLNSSKQTWLPIKCNYLLPIYIHVWGHIVWFVHITHFSREISRFFSQQPAVSIFLRTSACDQPVMSRAPQCSLLSISLSASSQTLTNWYQSWGQIPTVFIWKPNVSGFRKCTIYLLFIRSGFRWTGVRARHAHSHWYIFIHIGGSRGGGSGSGPPLF